jgi:hypothetical protein
MCSLDKRLRRCFEERLDVEMIVAEEHPQSTVGAEPAFLMRTPYAQGYHYSEKVDQPQDSVGAEFDDSFA